MVLRIVLPVRIPALLIKMVGLPNDARIACPVSLIAAGEVISHSKYRTLLGSVGSVGGVMSTMATLIPRAPNISATFLPIPPLPPVRRITSRFQS